jgi:hypothetical protein
MNILLLGSDGREHALAWKIAVSSLTERHDFERRAISLLARYGSLVERFDIEGQS